MAIDIKIKMDGIDRVTRMFDAFPVAQERGIISALNKLGSQGATITKRAVTERYNIKSSDVAKKIKLVRAAKETARREARHFVIITAAAQSFPLIQLGGLPQMPYPQKNIPVAARKTATVKILRDAPRRPVIRDKPSGRLPFVAKMRSGHAGIFAPTGPGQRTIREVYSRMNLIDMFQARGAKALTAMLQEKGMAIFLHELQYFTDKMKK